MNKGLDLNIWQPLVSGGAIPRQWRYVGVNRGKRCNFPVRLVEAHPSLPGFYTCQALAGMNCLYAPDWVLVGRDVIAYSEVYGGDK